MASFPDALDLLQWVNKNMDLTFCGLNTIYSLSIIMSGASSCWFKGEIRAWEIRAWEIRACIRFPCGRMDSSIHAIPITVRSDSFGGSHCQVHVPCDGCRSCSLSYNSGVAQPVVPKLCVRVCTTVCSRAGCKHFDTNYGWRHLQVHTRAPIFLTSETVGRIGPKFGVWLWCHQLNKHFTSHE